MADCGEDEQKQRAESEAGNEKAGDWHRGQCHTPSPSALADAHCDAHDACTSWKHVVHVQNGWEDTSRRARHTEQSYVWLARRSHRDARTSMMLLRGTRWRRKDKFRNVQTSMGWFEFWVLEMFLQGEVFPISDLFVLLLPHRFISSIPQDR